MVPCGGAEYRLDDIPRGCIGVIVLNAVSRRLDDRIACSLPLLGL